MRDLIRARFQVGKQQHRARQQLKMYLLRHNLRYGGQSSWTPAHLRYLAKIKMPFAVQQIVFQEMLEVISQATAQLERYDQEIERAVPGWRWEPAVRALMSLRGMALLHAATLVAELGDFNRFAHPGQLMGYLGLVPSEHTTGNDRQQGGITKMGNAPARRALVEAAWQYRAPARLSPALEKAPGRLAQDHHRYCLGGPTAITSPLHPSDARGQEEVPGGGHRSGPRTRPALSGPSPAKSNPDGDPLKPPATEKQKPFRKKKMTAPTNLF